MSAHATGDTAANPLLADWTTPHALPPFGAIELSDVMPAFEAAMAEHAREIAAIADNPDPPTFANTLLPMERAGERLGRVARVFFTLAGADATDEIQALQRQVSPKLTAHWNAITTNRALFARIDQVNASPPADLDPEDARLLARTHLGFVRSGARLEGAESDRLSEIKMRLSELSTAFSQNVLADETEWMLELSNPDDLAGLPQSLIDAAAAAAAERGKSGSHVITLARSLVEPFLVASTRQDLREIAYKAWVSRGANGNASDNREIIRETLALRHEMAGLLGFATYAEFKLDDTMAKRPERVRELLNAVWQPALRAAEDDRAALEALAAERGANGPLEPWDWRHYAEMLRRARFSINDAEVKPYLSLDAMIAAAFDTATRLFGLQFTPAEGLPLYHPDCRAFEVTDRDGRHVALFIGDYFARARKRSGAWMSMLRAQSNVDGRERPIVLNTCNFAKAPNGAPTLLSFDDARTLFHEFGHALHGMLSDVTYRSLSGTAVSGDFVELPSQLYEHWLMTDEVLTKHARHVETGAPMPDDLRERIKAARNYGQGFATVEYLASAIVDLEFHSDPEAAGSDPLAFQNAVLARIGMPPQIAMRHAAPHFQHIFSGSSYAAGYYSYMWSEVLDADAFKAFQETGNPFDAETAERLRANILSVGGTIEADDAYMAFRGRMPSIDGLLEKRGFAAPAG